MMSDNKTPEIRPCPWCGKTGIIDNIGSVWEPLWIVRCSSKYEECRIQPKTDDYEHKTQAVTYWNRRAPLRT